MQAKILAVFLDNHVGSQLRGPKQAMQRLIDRHFLRNAMGILMFQIYFPTCFQLDERQAIGRFAVDFVRRGKDENRIRSEAPRGFQQVERPLGVPLKSV